MAKKNNENKVQTRFKQPKRRLFLAQWRKYRDEMTQERLALAFGLNCQPADLIMRNPTDPKAPWTIWDRIKPELRAQALRVLETFADEEAA